MEEAKFSLNIRFNINGYDSQFTARADDSGIKLLQIVPQVLQTLEKLGAVPERRWESNGKTNGHHVDNDNGNGKSNQPEPPEPKMLECPIHHKAKKSKFGGLYCPVKGDDGEYCTWKMSAEELAGQ